MMSTGEIDRILKLPPAQRDQAFRGLLDGDTPTAPKKGPREPLVASVDPKKGQCEVDKTLAAMEVFLPNPIVCLNIQRSRLSGAFSWQPGVDLSSDNMF